MQTHDPHRQRVREFVRRSTKLEHLDDDLGVFKAGLVNSLFALKLVQFVEGTFGVTVENTELSLENFKCVDAICALLERKAGTAT